MEELDLKKLVNEYVWKVNDAEKAIQSLANDVDQLSREVQDHKREREAVQANMEALRGEEDALVEERNSLFRQHNEANFVQDTAKLQQVARRRVALDEELESVRESIRGCVTPHEDFSQRAATLELRKEELSERIPSISMLPFHLDILPNFLRSIYDSMQADSKRLRDKHKAISVPASYTSKQLEELKRANGTSKNLSPAYLQRQESRRREWEKETRRNNINHFEKKRREGAPAHTGKSILADRILQETTQV